MLEDVPEMRRAGSAGWAGVFNTYFWIDPASGVAAAVMTQLRPLFDGAVVATLADVERAVYA
jgi:CubicO group peptidase (beta-lactamase class C family)